VGIVHGLACTGDPAGDADDTGGSSTGSEAGDCWPDDPPGDPEASVMKTWGSACATDQECIDRLGDGAICMLDAIIFELPGGYCSKVCTLPDGDTTVVRDAMECDPGGGVHCVGGQGVFERCVVECTAAQQCDREGYFCRLMPLIAREDDPTICMMDDCCQDGCGDG
jgi:hypothetical protein